MPDAEIRRAALLSEDLRYRYTLTRDWGHGPRLGFVMLNPSTADASIDDQTIRKCMGYARRLGFPGIDVVNLYAFRSRTPTDLGEAHAAGTDVVGIGNDSYLRMVIRESPMVIAGWGVAKTGLPKGFHEATIERLRDALGGRHLHCLAQTKSRQPKHPCYLSYDLVPIPWVPVDGPWSPG